MNSSTTLWKVKAGDRLPVIADRVYGDARLWRLIADANEIDNPLRFPGQKDFGRPLLVPGKTS